MPKVTQLRGSRAREAILSAAGERFLADGLRGTSVEAIAAGAGVSRPTVYAHFASKDEVFRAIVADLHDEQLTAMHAAIDPAAPIADRLEAALAARFVPVLTLTGSSPHGAELLDEGHRVGGDIIREARERAVALLEELLADAEAAGELDLAVAGLTPEGAASVVHDAASGLKRDDAVTPAAYRRQLGRLIAMLTRGLAAG